MRGLSRSVEDICRKHTQCMRTVSICLHEANTVHVTTIPCIRTFESLMSNQRQNYTNTHKLKIVISKNIKNTLIICFFGSRILIGCFNRFIQPYLHHLEGYFQLTLKRWCRSQVKTRLACYYLQLSRYCDSSNKKRHLLCQIKKRRIT